MTRRMTNGHRGYSLNIKIHFNGDKLPSHVSIYGGREKVHPYVAPIVMCDHCLRYGHHAKACKAPRYRMRCARCGENGHRKDECEVARATCVHCKKTHEATAKECPEKIRQENIRILMTGERMNFKEVIEFYPQYTSKNQFNLLANLKDFPALQRQSYAKQLRQRRQYVYLDQRKRQISTPKRPDKYSSHFTQQTIHSTNYRPIQSNPHRVTEFEKMMSELAGAGTHQKENIGNFTVLSEFLNESMQNEERNDRNLINMTSPTQNPQIQYD